MLTREQITDLRNQANLELSDPALQATLVRTTTLLDLLDMAEGFVQVGQAWLNEDFDENVGKAVARIIRSFRAAEDERKVEVRSCRLK